jgi:hypothetical protein
LAEQDAAVGDFTQALRSLEAAATLSGGTLPPEWARKRADWQSGHVTLARS